MSGKKYFDVRTSAKIYRMTLEEGTDLVQRMDRNSYDLSSQELQCAQRFENFFLELKRQCGQRCWGVVRPPV
ncbi:MAG: hypothetical protein P8I83_06685 [Paracoccaceae bacterium]|nr:hypothetical protein [Paracoccaceae bacterium]